MKSRITSAMRAILVGMSQIMLQNNPWTGALFLLGIALNSIPMFGGALLGVICATFTARLLSYDRKEIADGLYGFNGALVGIAMVFFLPLQASTVVLLIVGAALSSVIMQGFLQEKLPAFTAPFVLTTWVLLLVAHLPGAAATTADPAALAHLDIVSAVFAALGQVMFQGSVVTGIVFLAGLCCSSWRDAVWSLTGCALGLLVALLAGYPLPTISAGLFGYNGALCGIALARRHPVYPLLAIIVSVFLTGAFATLGTPALTAPFVLATWGALAAGFRSRDSEEIPAD